MPMSSKFFTESSGENIVKIGQYLAKIWTKYDSLVFLGPPCTFSCSQFTIHVCHFLTTSNMKHVS